MLWASEDLAGNSRIPHTGQVFRLERVTWNLEGELKHREVSFGITSLGADRAPPERLLALSRGHWCIENRIHWVRDVTFDEDRSQVRKRAGARVLASMRNLAIGLLRMAGATNIASALRRCAAKVSRALRLLGL
jgi:hypothetical protein